MARNNSIQTLPKTACTGCMLCGDACPQNSIEYKCDEEGFFYPHLCEDKCLDCGICRQKCPAINVNQHPAPDSIFSGYASDVSVNESGSSGGVFWLLATSFLNVGGIVYGAAFDEKLQLKHQRVDCIGNLRQLCKSKYMQSDVSGIYRKVKEDLLQDKSVLFVGTPCQCQALNNFVGDKLVGKLLIVDFVCHGVPSQKLFDENLKWNERKYGKIKSIEFRYKGKKVLHPQTLKMVYEKNGMEKSVLRMHYQDPFYFGFQKHITLRPSCYHCKWAKPERCSDITLADFWGIEKANAGLDSKNGVSCVLANTAKGREFFNSIKMQLAGITEQPLSFAIENNSCLSSPTVVPPYRAQFFEDWKRMGYDSVVNKYLTPNRKWIFDLYYAIPTPLRKFIRKLMNSRIKYE